MKLKNSLFIRILSIVSIFVLLFNMMPMFSNAAAHDVNEDNSDTQLRFWENEQPDIGFYINGVARYTLETVTEPSMGTGAGEWSVMSLLRGMSTGYDYINYIDDDYFDGYLSRIETYVDDNNGDLHQHKSSEWSRLILALSALDYDIKDVAGYDFIEKLSESHSFSHYQGINGAIYAMIAMNTGEYNFYADENNSDVNNYGKLLDYILELEIEQSDGTTGGWALFGNSPDSDITGMALQALAPYYNEKKLYEQTTAQTPYEEFATAVERGVSILAEIQSENGAFEDFFGNLNLESTAQVIVALTALGIDPLSYSVELQSLDRNISFITDGGNVRDDVYTDNMIDALLVFWADGSGSEPGVGGFERHGMVNAMATDQALYGLIAYDRFLKGENPLYDMTDMMTAHGGTPYTEYEAQKLNVTFVEGDGAESQEEEESPYSILEIPEGSSSEGREFISWNSEKDGSGTVYHPGEKLSMPEHDITLYAQYEYAEYSINYETNGGTFTIDEPHAFTVADKVLLPTAEHIEKEEYKFVGWYENEEFSGNEITEIPTGSTGNKTFHAKWESHEAAVKAVKEKIDALPSEEDITLEDRKIVKQAKTAYDELNANQQNEVSNYEKLEVAETKIAELSQASGYLPIQKVENMIDALPNTENVSLENKNKIEDTRLTFDTLMSEQQTMVENTAKLQELEAKINELQGNYNKEKATDVDEAIESLAEEFLREQNEEESKDESEQLQRTSTNNQDATNLTPELREEVTEVRTAFYSLNPEQQQLVETGDLFDSIENKLFELEEMNEDQIAANKVEMMIAGLPEPSEVSLLSDQEWVDQVNAAYSELTDAQRELVTNDETQKLDQLNSTLTDITEQLDVQASANTVTYEISNLPGIMDITLDDEGNVDAVRQAFNELAEEAQTLVSNEDYLIALEEELTALQAEQENKGNAQEVEEMIVSLPSVDEITLEDKEDIEAARQAFNELSEEAQALVPNENDLTALEEELAVLEVEQEDKGEAQEVEKIIERLPGVDEVTLEDKDLIAEATEAFNNLTDNQKQYVENADQLTALGNKMKELESSEGIPVPKDPKDPEDQEEPKGESTPSENEKPDNGESQALDGMNNQTGQSDRLPDTATNSFNYLLIGLLLVVLGVTIHFVYRRRKAL